MLEAAYEQAAQKLAIIKTAQSMLLMTGEVSTFQENFSIFLQNTHSLFSKLENGSKSNSKSNSWYTNIRRLRKIDPLLVYLKQARNVDEHCIQNISSPTGASAEFSPNGTAVFTVSFYDDGYQDWSVVNRDENGVELSKSGGFKNFRLLRIVARGVEYYPPNKHLNEDTSGCSPIELVNITVSYLERVLEEARQLV